MNANAKPVKNILALDGGGVRGLIPARILQEFETRMNKPASEIFDFIIGTSSGGITAIAATLPDKDGKPLFAAKDIVQLYYTKADDIFHPVKFSLGGLFSAKYDSSRFDPLLNEYCRDLKISELLIPAAITTYDLYSEKPLVWSTYDAQRDKDYDAYVKDLIKATSAAPTYFAPHEFSDQGGNKYLGADGAIFTNSPQIAALAELEEAFDEVEPNDMLLISIGTGAVEKGDFHLCNTGATGWLPKIIDMMIDGEGDLIDLEARLLFHKRYRLEVDIPIENSALDNTSPENLQTLLELTEDYIRRNDKLFDEVTNALKSYTYSDEL